MCDDKGKGQTKAVRRKHPLTDEEKYLLELQVEAECDRLKREYILLDRDRSQCAGGTNRTIVQQRKVLNIFEKEHSNVLDDLHVANTLEKKRNDIKNNDKLCEMLSSYEFYKERVITTKRHIKELEGQIKLVKKEVLKLEALQVSDRQYEERICNAVKSLETLENRLEVQIRKFCTICAKNRELRELINHLLMERRDFMKIWNKLINNLNKGKRFMLDFIEQATMAYDQREDWCRKLSALRAKAYNDLMVHTQEMRRLKRKEDNDIKLETFYQTKSQKRVMRDLEAKEKMQREERRNQLQEMMSEYKMILNEINTFVGENDLDVIVRTFIKNEDENFMHFRYINDLNEEMDGVNDRLTQLHIDIDREKVLYEMRVEQQAKTIEDLKQELMEAKAKRKATESDLALAESKLSTMVQGVGSLFQKCKCDNDPLLRLLGDNNTARSYNVLLYLEILEKKVHFLLLATQYRYKKGRMPGGKIFTDTSKKPQIGTLEAIAQTNPCPLCVEHEYVSDVIDVLQKPLSREEIKQKLAQRLALPDGLLRVHNVSACHLPKSREIIQKRYQ